MSRTERPHGGGASVAYHEQAGVTFARRVAAIRDATRHGRGISHTFAVAKSLRIFAGYFLVYAGEWVVQKVRHYRTVFAANKKA